MDPDPAEVEEIRQESGCPVHDLSELNEDLESMLALLSLIDEYIAVSNTNVHLRTATGSSCRVLVPYPPEWRWMSTGKESPWFPGTRIYRQHFDGNWKDALTELKTDLSA